MKTIEDIKLELLDLLKEENAEFDGYDNDDTYQAGYCNAIKYVLSLINEVNTPELIQAENQKYHKEDILGCAEEYDYDMELVYHYLDDLLYYYERYLGEEYAWQTCVDSAFEEVAYQNHIATWEKEIEDNE